MKEYPRFPHFRLYVTDFLTSPRVVCMTTTQVGGYVKLLCYCWRSGDCSLPRDLKRLQSLAGLDLADLKIVRPMFINHPTHPRSKLTNARLYQEHQSCIVRYDQRIQAGKKSGEARRTSVERPLNESPTKAERKGNQSESESESESEEEKKVKKEHSLWECKKETKESQPLAALAPPDNTGHLIFWVPQVIFLWNEIPGVLHCPPSIQKKKGPTLTRILTQLKQHPDPAWWENLRHVMTQSNWLIGLGDYKNGEPFRASLYWALGPINLEKILTGFYVKAKGTAHGKPTPGSDAYWDAYEAEQALKKSDHLAHDQPGASQLDPAPDSGHDGTSPFSR